MSLFFNKEELRIANADGSNDIEVVDLEDKDLCGMHDIFWSFDGEKLFLQASSCNPNSDGYNHYLISAEGKIISELPENIGRIFSSGDWSPDSQLFLFERYVERESGFDTELALLNTNSMEITVLEIEDWYWGCDRIMWVP